MRVIDLQPGHGPKQWGQSHGESFRGEIRSLAAIRIHLTIRIGGFDDEREVLGVAAQHLPVLERYDRALHDEVVGIAEGAGVTPAHVVVVNHYTDLRDIKRSRARHRSDAEGADPGGCSILWTRGAGAPILAQTWDMHASAIPYVAMLRVPAVGDRPAALLLTITGCLGMCGMNQRGVGVAINNLTSTDAQVGIVWPALVRRALLEGQARAARDLVLAAPLGSGHHYLVADPSEVFGIETSGDRRKQIFAARADAQDPASQGHGSAYYVHTNHCLDSHIAARTRIPEGSTTHERYRWLDTSAGQDAVTSITDAWRRLGSDEGYPRSVCTNMATPENPHGAATCGGIAMELGAGEVWAQSGLIHNVAPRRFDFGCDKGGRAGQEAT